MVCAERVPKERRLGLDQLATFFTRNLVWFRAHYRSNAARAQFVLLLNVCNNFGNFAILAAIRRASLRRHSPASRRSPGATVPFGPYNSIAVAQFGPLPL